MTQVSWVLKEGDEPIVAVALHDGHAVREEVAKLFAISESDRTREEDPFTATWTTIADTQIVAKRSRFEFDLNRPREKAVYLKPQDAWGLSLWHTPPSEEIVARFSSDDTKSALIDPFSFPVVETFHRNVSTLVVRVAEKGGSQPGFRMRCSAMPLTITTAERIPPIG
jgi:hypothetical protein